VENIVNSHRSTSICSRDGGVWLYGHVYSYHSEAEMINVEILEDGTVRWDTGRIPGEHHNAADEFQAELEAALGGEVKRTQKVAKGPHVHTDQKGHTHEHNHG